MSAKPLPSRKLLVSTTLDRNQRFNEATDVADGVFPQTRRRLFSRIVGGQGPRNASLHINDRDLSACNGATALIGNPTKNAA
jgi:hypothetical protein